MKYKKYPSYKDSGVDWLGEIPSEWANSKLKFYLDKLVAGGTPKTDNIDFWTEFNDGIPWVSIADMTKNDLISETKKNVTYKGISEKNLKILSKGTLLYSIFASLGKVAIANVPLTTNQAILGIVPNHKINKNYLYWLLIGLENYVKFSANSNTQDNLNSEKVANFPISVPKLKEQQQIADFLDKATAKIDTLIEKQTKQIELLKEKRQAVISHAVTKGLDINNSHWKNYRLDWINTIIRGNTGFKKDELLENGEYVALQYGKTYKVDEVNETFNFYVNNEFYKFNQIVNYGDTILISTSETIEDLGHSCFYNRKDLGLIGGEQILLKPNIKFVHEKYLYYSSKIFSTKLKKYATGLKVFRFSIDDLKELFISIPGLEEQQQIANYLDEKTSKIDILIEKSKKSIELLKEKRTALISAAVTGKIDVREFA